MKTLNERRAELIRAWLVQAPAGDALTMVRAYELAHAARLAVSASRF